MSAHLFVVAGYLDDLEPAAKLILMALADSADDDGTGSIPGLEKMRAWSGRSRSRVLEIVNELIAAGWVERTADGRRGHRATFRVFPRGIPPIPSAGDVAARYGSDRSDPSTGYPQVWTTPRVVHNPPDLGSGPSDLLAELGSDTGPDTSDPSDPFRPTLPSKERATPPLRTAPVVDRRPAGYAATALPASNNGPAERPIAEVLTDTRRTKPANATVRAAEVRQLIATAKAARRPTPPPEETAP